MNPYAVFARTGDVHVCAASLPATEYTPANFQLNMVYRARGNMILEERKKLTTDTTQRTLTVRSRRRRAVALLEEVVVEESDVLQAAILQVRQGLRHNFVVGEFVHGDVHFGLRGFQRI
jgi:hypothetical protein